MTLRAPFLDVLAMNCPDVVVVVVVPLLPPLVGVAVPLGLAVDCVEEPVPLELAAVNWPLVAMNVTSVSSGGTWPLESLTTAPMKELPLQLMAL